jgi:hypothetical protein
LQAAFAFLKQLYTQGGVPTQTPNANNQRIINLAPGIAGTDAANVNQVTYVLGAPQGTRVVFQQAAAPAGWAIDNNSVLQDCAMRFNSGASNGGTVNWSSWNFGGTFAVTSVALTVAQMPAHAHNDAGHGTPISDGGHGHGVNWSDPGHNHVVYYNGGGGPLNGFAGPIGTSNLSTSTGTSGTGISMSIQASGSNIGAGTGYANIQNTGGGATHNHTFVTPQVKFADCVVGVKQ